ncbi:MAG TPA: NAD(P)/FAD-dependent oxidoreductase, partial [Actinomycetes bacterium]|nr:NAD(P)/FAD-dependent oxidoreductase [Actinomycetes bacterium]
MTRQFGSEGNDRDPVRVETVVIGAGQAGLAAGYHLARRGREFTILDAGQRVGDNWRTHWDSLRLYSPAWTAALPGMRFPAPPAAYPTKDEMADFLETYASTFELPVRTGVRVRRLAREADGYLVTTDGPSFRCDNVVVASGTFGRTPYVPDFAGQLHPGIVQLHSSAYKRPAQLRPGTVLLVGAGNSGAEIAMELRRGGHPVLVAGPDVGNVPGWFYTAFGQAVFAPLLFRGIFHRLLTESTPPG